MGEGQPALSGESWKYAIVALGGGYVALAAGRAFGQFAGDAPPGGTAIQALLIAAPGVVLVVGGARLPRIDISPDLYPRIAGWCGGGFCLMFGLLALYHAQPSGSVSNPLSVVPILTGLASAAGFTVGRHDAQARTRAREAEQRSRELERRTRELGCQNERLESFAEMLVRELRDPLDVARLYHEQTRSGDEAAAEEVEVALNRIEDMIEVLLVTVKGPQANIGYEPVEIGDVATDVWSEVVASSEPATLVVEADQTILATPVHLRHLFANLFRNSVEHGAPNDPTASSDGDRRSEAVTVRVGRLDGGFYVADDGRGIAEERRDDVVEAGVTTKEEGIGLGLTYVVQLAETYGWEWTIDESKRGGVVLTFTNVDLPTPEEIDH